MCGYGKQPIDVSLFISKMRIKKKIFPLVKWFIIYLLASALLFVLFIFLLILTQGFCLFVC